MNALLDKEGRGTNRMIAMCRKHGAPPPRFEERQGFLIACLPRRSRHRQVTFKVQTVAGSGAACRRINEGRPHHKTSAKAGANEK